MPPTDYLVRYGRPAYVGRFRDPGGRTFLRGQAVAVRSPRGAEAGEVLAPTPPTDGGTVGDLLGPCPTDSGPVAAEVLDAARSLIAGFPVAVVDGEQLLDPVVVLHVVSWGTCDLTPILDELSLLFGMAVRVHHLGREPVPEPDPPAGCGKPDCGRSAGGCSSCGPGGGCSTGGCSRGAATSADDLTAYFADLRNRMESMGRVPLN